MGPGSTGTPPQYRQVHIGGRPWPRPVFGTPTAPRGRILRTWGPALGIVGLLLVAAAIVPAGATAEPRSAVPLGGQSVLSASVTWNGVDVRSYTTPSAALGTNFASTIDVHYSWSASPGPTGAPGLFNVSDARLQIFYFGAALATRDVIESAPQAASSGTMDMTWNAGFLEWAAEGIYQVTASLLATNGTTVWAESFYVHVAAPYSVLAVLPLLLLVVGIYEVYGLLTSGRYARRNRPATRAPVGSTTGKEPGAGTEAAPPAGGPAPPPSEGGEDS